MGFKGLGYFNRIKDRFDHGQNSPPLHISVMGGATGLGCNGIHWIDFALHLTGSTEGELLYGELQSTRIASGRGPRFQDYGGTAIYGFPNGSRLVLNLLATSSAPTVFTICEAHQLTLVDQDADVTVSYVRDADLRTPEQ